MMLTMEATKVGEVYRWHAKYILRGTLILKFLKIRQSKFPHFQILVEARIMHVICPYPTKESTKISTNRANVSFGLSFLLEKQEVCGQIHDNCSIIIP